MNLNRSPSESRHESGGQTRCSGILFSSLSPVNSTTDIHDVCSDSPVKNVAQTRQSKKRPNYFKLLNHSTSNGVYRCSQVVDAHLASPGSLQPITSPNACQISKRNRPKMRRSKLNVAKSLQTTVLSPLKGKSYVLTKNGGKHLVTFYTDNVKKSPVKHQR